MSSILVRVAASQTSDLIKLCLYEMFSNSLIGS